MHFHVRGVLTRETRCYLACAAAIEIPLLFLNGEWDEYTTAADARLFTAHVRQCQFSTIGNAGHFLDMEHKTARRDTCQALLGFLQPAMATSAPLLDGHRYTELTQGLRNASPTEPLAVPICGLRLGAVVRTYPAAPAGQPFP